jgi:uncharacterized phage protein (TIGR01671 family)
MNDRFRFRAWDKTNKIMIDEIGDGWFRLNFKNVRESDEFVLEQCTGLKDKNGKLIYEGDILRRKDSAGRMVEWDDNELAFFFTTLDEETSTPLACYDMQELELEVVGNIHENPELLEADNGGTN